MNCLIWNCRGAGGRNFHNFVRDCIRIYHLDFVALLEPRISGPAADKVIQKIGLTEGVWVEAIGFSGVIWCLWKSNCPSIRIAPLSSWKLSVVYASPSLSQREETWNELRNYSLTVNGPWIVSGNFNDITSNRGKQGGAPPIQSSCLDFRNCIEDCNVIDLGFFGPPYTWSRGDVREILDRFLSNSAWLTASPSCSIIHLPILSFDHCGLWIRHNAESTRRSNYFKFLGSS